LEVANNVAITSVITSTSAQRLGLKVGKVVYAMVKSSNVMIATSDALQQFAEGFLT
jgi:molybdopterin-binding protein